MTAAELLRSVTLALSSASDEEAFAALPGSLERGDPGELGWEDGTLSIPVPGLKATMILTGDVKLMNVDDPAVPFGRVRDEFRAADIVFSNLECCLYEPPSGHAPENEGFFASPVIGGEAMLVAGPSTDQFATTASVCGSRTVMPPAESRTKSRLPSGV